MMYHLREIDFHRYLPLFFLFLTTVFTDQVQAQPQLLTMTINGQSGPATFLSCRDDVMNISAISPISAAKKKRKWKWILFRNGEVVATREEKHKCNVEPCYFFPDWTFQFPITQGDYQVKLKVEEAIFSFLGVVIGYDEIYDDISNPIQVSAVNAATAFSINGQTSFNVSACERDAIILDGSASTCETQYRITLENISTGTEGTTDWMESSVPNNVDLRAIASQLGVPLLSNNRYRVTLITGVDNPFGAPTTFSSSKEMAILIDQQVSGVGLTTAHLCLNESKTLTVSEVSGVPVSWSIPSFLTVTDEPDPYTRVVTATEEGLGTIQVTYRNLCDGNVVVSREASSYASVPEVQGIAGPPSLCLVREQSFGAMATNAVNYSWSGQGFIFTSPNYGPSVTILPDSPGFISLSASNGCGSAGIVNMDFTVEWCGGGGSGPYLVAPTHAQAVYPNPAIRGEPIFITLAGSADEAKVTADAEAPHADIKWIKLTDVHTNKQVRFEVTSSQLQGGRLQLNTTHLKRGLYSISWVDGGKLVSHRIQITE